MAPANSGGRQFVPVSSPLRSFRPAPGACLGSAANQMLAKLPGRPAISTVALPRDMSFAPAKRLERQMPSAPSTSSQRTAEGVRLALTGDWTVGSGRSAEAVAHSLVAAAAGAASATIDLDGVEHLDTAGAWLIDRSRAEMAASGVKVGYVVARRRSTRSCCARPIIAASTAPARPHVDPLIGAPQRYRRERLHVAGATYQRRRLPRPGRRRRPWRSPSIRRAGA